MASARPRWGLLPLLVLSAFILAGCAQDSVSNQTDAFSYGGQVAGKSGTQRYTWKVTGSTVTINWGGQSASGTMDLTLKDGQGQTVYTRSFSGASQSGVSDTLRNVKTGDWQVILDFHGFTGQMGLSLSAGGAPAPGS
ncbi:MAG: hypothetical protein QOI63_1371, partial [Thermoplasmata archaeon]|nr:hypothetical protein [Thermoplasmata archaeon]